jgi:hypothetical protein
MTDKLESDVLALKAILSVIIADTDIPSLAVSAINAIDCYAIAPDAVKQRACEAVVNILDLNGPPAL